MINKQELVEHVWSFGFGGMEKAELEFLIDFCSDKIILELGSEVGQSSYVMASVAKSVTCVDIWDDSYEHLNHDVVQKEVYLNAKNVFKDEAVNKNNIFQQFCNNCKEFIASEKIRYIKGKTGDVVSKFRNEFFDVILIDADHSYEGVRSDIENYIYKLKKGGILIFHDYGCGVWTGVKQACDEFESNNIIELVEQFQRVAIFKLKG